MTMPYIPTEWTHDRDFDNKELHRITIHRMNSPFYDGDRYCVRNSSGSCLNNSLEWEYEPTPSNRDDDFYERCRFKSWSKALEAANKKREEKGVR